MGKTFLVIVGGAALLMGASTTECGVILSKDNDKNQQKEIDSSKKRSDKTVIQTNENDFQKDVLAKDFVVVDFYANWCGPCRMILPYLEEIASELNVDIVKVNIDESPNIASQYNVMSIPTIIIFKNGEKISTNVGAASKARLIDWIKAHIDS